MSNWINKLLQFTLHNNEQGSHFFPLNAQTLCKTPPSTGWRSRPQRVTKSLRLLRHGQKSQAQHTYICTHVCTGWGKNMCTFSLQHVFHTEKGEKICAYSLRELVRGKNPHFSAPLCSYEHMNYQLTFILILPCYSEACF